MIRFTLFALTILLSLWRCSSAASPPARGNSSNSKVDLVEYLYRYRVVNWCVTGTNEPGLFDWPFVQFKPFLLRTRSFQKYEDFVEVNDTNTKKGDDAKDYETLLGSIPPDMEAGPNAELKFKKIWCEDRTVEELDVLLGRPTTKYQYAPGGRQAIPPERYLFHMNADLANEPATPVLPIGHHTHLTNPGNLRDLYRQLPFPRTGHLHQRVHIELKLSYPSQESEDKFHGVEGVLIQANHAPFGMGFPFGQFYRGEDTEGDYPCKCEHNWYRVIPCLSRPDVEILTPTVAAFHYEMLKYSQTDQTGTPANPAPQYPKTLRRVGRQKEFHFNFKWHSHPCSAANIVQFFVLIVHDFYRRKYEIKTFGPYDFSALSFRADEFKRMGGKGDRAKFEAAEFAERFNNLRWLTPVSHIPVPPPAPGALLPVPGTPGLVWLGPTPVPAAPALARPIIPATPATKSARGGFVQNPLYMPSPILPECRRTRLPSPDCEPDPLTGNCEDKEFYSQNCHSTRLVGADQYYFPREVLPPATRDPDPRSGGPNLRFNGFFDIECLTRYPRAKEAHRQCGNWTGRYRCDTNYETKQEKYTYQEILVLNKRLQTDMPINPKDRLFDNTYCEPCKYEETTPLGSREPERDPIFKRSAHGALMMIAFIYLMPMAMLIGRYYKETLHTWESKGWRLWLWIHVGLYILSMVVAYTAYNLETFWALDKHMWLGYTAMFSGASGLISGWGRHKTRWVRELMFWIHAIPGYIAVPCAACCMFWSASTDTSFAAQWTIMSSTILMATIMVALDCCVFCNDRRLGMVPRRSHIPVLHVRFEDTFTRGHQFRRKFLYVVAGLYGIPILLAMFI